MRRWMISLIMCGFVILSGFFVFTSEFTYLVSPKPPNYNISILSTEAADKIYDAVEMAIVKEKFSKVNNSLAKLKLIQEITNKTYESIMMSTLQAKPVNKRAWPGTMQVVIASNYRSGSTFLEEFLVSHPGMFNHYEPLLMYSFQRFYRGDNNSEDALNIIQGLLNCRYGNEKYMQALKKYPDLLQRNTRLWDVCKLNKRDGKLCYERSFLEAACSLYPWSVMKLVRAGVELLEPLFEDEALNPHLVFLVRDPRAITNSRLSTVKWCKTRQCSDPSILCNEMSKDLTSALDLRRKYPGRVHILRYEDLALSPYAVGRKLVRDIGLDFDPAMEKFIKDHTTKNFDKPWSTMRESSKRVTFWTTRINENIMKYVQTWCSQIMVRLGYLAVESKNNATLESILVPLNLTEIT